MKTIDAAKYYLQYQGMRGTEKQIDKLMKQFNNNQIIFLAKQRGFNQLNSELS